MAGDWIKMRTSLLSSPKVNGIARYLETSKPVSQALATGHSGHMGEIVTRNVMRHVTVSSLLVVWGAANEHTKDGVFENADLSDIDDMVGIPGFGEAMSSVGWAVFDPDGYSVNLPNFGEYNTSGASRTASAKSGAERQKEYRDRKKASVGDGNGDAKSDVTRDRREEKSREEEKITPPNPPAGGNAGTFSEKKARVKAERMTLKTFLDRCRESSERPISDYEPLSRYITESGLPIEFVNLCWQEFKRDFLPGGKNDRKQQARWRQHFQNFVERNFYHLWYAKTQGDGVSYELTTVGLQAQMATKRREAA